MLSSRACCPRRRQISGVDRYPGHVIGHIGASLPQRPGRADGRIPAGLQLQLGVQLRPQQHLWSDLTRPLAGAAGSVVTTCP
jgi:hypothetical protein